MTRLVAILILLAISTPAFAERRVQLPTPAERRVADLASWGTVLASVALDTRASVACADRRRCLELQGGRIGLTYAAVFAAKLLVHRARPCAPDSCGASNPNYSFFSGHSALAFSTVGGARLSVSVPLAAMTGALRVSAGKHYVSDVVTGALVGGLVSRIR